MLDRRLTLDHFRAFVAVVECGSFSEAAQQLSRTQSALTHQIQALEDILSKRLLVRSRGHFGGLTSEGVELLPHAKRVLGSVRSALRSVGPASLSGKLRIGVMDDFDMQWLMDLIARFNERHPNGEISAISDLSARLEDRLRRNEIDIAIVKRLVAAPASLSSAALLREKLRWAHGLGFCRDPRDALPLVVFHEGCVYREHLLGLLKQAQIAFRIAYAGYSYANVRAAAAAGLGVAALPESQIDTRHLLSSNEAATSIGLPDLGWAELVVKTSDERPNPIVLAFQKDLEGSMGQNSYSSSVPMQIS